MNNEQIECNIINAFLNKIILGPGKSFTCIGDQELPFIIQECVLDDPKYDETDCILASDGKTKDNCGYWQNVDIETFIDFFNWNGFGKLYEWAKEQKCFWHFIDEHGGFFNFVEEDDETPCSTEINTAMSIKYIDTSEFPRAIYTYLKEQEEFRNKLF